MISNALVERDKELLGKIQTAATESVLRGLPDMTTMSWSEVGGLARSITVGALQEFGNLAKITSTQSYKDMRASALPLAREIDVPVDFAIDDATVESIVGYTMSSVETTPNNALATGIGYAVGMDYRNTRLSAVGYDSMAVGEQRIAGPGACSFCAFASAMYDPGWRQPSFGDKEKFHNHCRCSLVPMFKNVSVFNAPYQEKYVEDSHAAISDIRSAQRSARERFFRENPDARQKDFFKAYPKLSVTTENIMFRLRQMGYN